MALKTLGLRVKPTSTVRLGILDRKPGVEQRIRGRKGVAHRKAILQEHDYLCAQCKENGRVSAAAHVDHKIPLEDGGTNDPSNEWPLCLECHKAKTKAEAAARAAR